jgi:hypothetical protein
MPILFYNSFLFFLQNTEIQNIQVLAEKDIRKKVKEFKITEKAETNARIFLDQWIRSFGFTSLKISTI